MSLLKDTKVTLLNFVHPEEKNIRKSVQITYTTVEIGMKVW